MRLVSCRKPAAWRFNRYPVRGSPRSSIKRRHPGDVPAFYQRLVRNSDVSALGLRYLILTALRTGEARFATIDEIDRDAVVVHAIPAERTKTRTARRVPLSSEALAVLNPVEQRRTSAFLLVASERGKPISDMAMLEKLRGLAPGPTVYGSRSAFRDWCGEIGVDRQTGHSATLHDLRRC